MFKIAIPGNFAKKETMSMRMEGKGSEKLEIVRILAGQHAMFAAMAGKACFLGLYLSESHLLKRNVYYTFI